MERRVFFGFVSCGDLGTFKALPNRIHNVSSFIPMAGRSRLGARLKKLPLGNLSRDVCCCG